jgi:hypothetical protein
MKILRRLDAVAQRGTFASRDPVLLQEFPEIAATNVITLVDKVDRAIDGFREHYDGCPSDAIPTRRATILCSLRSTD